MYTGMENFFFLAIFANNLITVGQETRVGRIEFKDLFSGSSWDIGLIKY
jgi:hypothetical protein